MIMTEGEEGKSLALEECAEQGMKKMSKLPHTQGDEPLLIPNALITLTFLLLTQVNQ